MKTDISDLRSELVEEARSRLPTPAGKDEITSGMLAEDIGCSTKQAYVILAGMVEDGKATVRKNGPHGQYVYKMTK